MSSFWSIWITVLTLGTLVGCYLLLRMCLKKTPVYLKANQWAIPLMVLKN